MITNSPTSSGSHAASNSSASGIRTQIAGVNVADLAREYGTPLYAYDADMIRQRCRDLAAWDTVRFAQKACSNIAVLDLIRREGVMVDAVSTGEIHRATARRPTPAAKARSTASGTKTSPRSSAAPSGQGCR